MQRRGSGNRNKLRARFKRTAEHVNLPRGQIFQLFEKFLVAGARRFLKLLAGIALRLEEVALTDDYFVERKLYPNVDFYSGLIYRAMGFPVAMFPVLFAIGRLPGWIAHWKEANESPKTKLNRPRQIYTGANERKYMPIDQR